MRTGKLSVEEKNQILTGLEKKDDLKIIAKNLNRSVAIISKYIRELKQVLEVKEEDKKDKKDNFFINKTAGGKEGGVTIMTEASSERGDSLRDKMGPPTPEGVHKIF